MATEEDWETGSGLALDGAVVTVTAAEFGFNANMGAGITCLNLTLTNEDGEDIDQSFSVGGKFESNRDGTAITGAGRINRNSNYGLLIESVKEVCDNPAEAIGDPKEAESWIGTKWEFGSVERETTNPTTGVTKKSSKFIVTEYLGRDDEDADEAPAKKASGSKASGSKASAKSKGGAKKASLTDGIDADLLSELIDLANEHDELEDFIEAAMELDAVSEDSAVSKAVMRPQGVWAAAGKDA